MRHPSHWVLGDAASQRVTDYRAAAVRLGMPAPHCLPWIDVLHHGPAALDDIPRGACLRIDSFGQSDQVLAALVRRGGGRNTPQRAEVRALDYQHQGLCSVLRDVEHWSRRRPDVRLAQSPLDIQTMFDKWATHQRLLTCASAVERPPVASPTATRPDAVLLPCERNAFEAARQSVVERFKGRAFLKPRYASSASGVCFYRIANRGEQLIAPIEIRRIDNDVRLFNSLRVRCYTKLWDIRDILGVLLPQGMIAEAAVNKARVDGERFDLRIVVIYGSADHIVVRQSVWPMTNLHLGNRRGSIEAAIAAMGAQKLDECRRLAQWAASCFPETLYCGVDILPPNVDPPLVCEVNAFGDFLPRLTAAGRTVYEAIIEAEMRRWRRVAKTA